MDIIYKKAEAKDVDQIKAVADLLQLDIPGFIWNSRTHIEKHVGLGEYFMGVKNGEVAGIISLRQRNNKMYIETISVSLKHRAGKVGTGLINLAKQLTREKGLTILAICSFYQYNSIDFYKNQGFIMKKPGIFNGNPYHYFEMEIA